MYHSIAHNTRDPHCVSPDEFERQMDKLAHSNTKVLDLPSAVERLAWGEHFWNQVVLTFDDALKDFLDNAVPILRAHAMLATVFVPCGLVGGCAVWDSYDKRKQLMNWDELQEVQRLGFAIASHTVSHPFLTHCDPATLAYELRASLDLLRERLPGTIPFLSYPGGYFGQREMQAAHAAGYEGAVGVSSRLENYPWTNRYRLRRRRWGE